MRLIDLRDKSAHFIAGFVAGLVPSIFHSLMVIMLFLIYEFVEMYKIRDKAYPEIREFTAGFITAIVYKYQLLGVIH